MIITIEDIRLFLNDNPEANKLIRKCEFSPERIKKACSFVISEWNETPPFVDKYTEENFPYKQTMLYGVLAYLYAGEATSQARNHLTYQSGGLTIDDSENAASYLNFSNFFTGKFKDLLERQKKVENIERGWGTISSGYYSE